jgi:hypothetical protein
MKRALQFSEWLINEVLEGVTYQQYMFTMPKIIRPYFKYDRSLLGKLCLCALETIKEFFAACLPKDTVPGAIISIQTWGNRGANFHLHLHGLVSKGAFDAHGVFYPLPWIDTQRVRLQWSIQKRYPKPIPNMNPPIWAIYAMPLAPGSGWKRRGFMAC